MKNESVAHRTPPRLSIKATMAIRRRKPRAASGPWKRGEIRSFMGLAGGGLEGAFNFHLKFTTDATAVGVGDPVPNIGTGGVPVEPAGVCDAGADCGRNGPMSGNPRVIEVIEEDYHDALDAPGIGAHAK